MDAGSFIKGFASGLEKAAGAVSDLMPRDTLKLKHSKVPSEDRSEGLITQRTAVGRALRAVKSKVKPKEFRKQHEGVAKIIKKIKHKGGGISGAFAFGKGPLHGKPAQRGVHIRESRSHSTSGPAWKKAMKG